MMDVEGWWELKSWAQQYDRGDKLEPFGAHPVGRLVYGDDGHFSIMIARSDRARFRTGGQWTANSAEKAAAYDGVLAYFGRYAIDGNTMTHHVEASLYPDWEGGMQKRQLTLEGDLLTLSGRLEEGTSEARTASLVWQRLRD